MRKSGRFTRYAKFLQDTIWEVCGFVPYDSGAVELLQGLQGQTGPQGKGGDIHLGQAEAGQAKQCPRHHEAAAANKVLSTCMINSSSPLGKRVGRMEWEDEGRFWVAVALQRQHQNSPEGANHRGLLLLASPLPTLRSF